MSHFVLVVCLLFKLFCGSFKYKQTICSIVSLKRNACHMYISHACHMHMNTHITCIYHMHVTCTWIHMSHVYITCLSHVHEYTCRMYISHACHMYINTHVTCIYHMHVTCTWICMLHEYHKHVVCMYINMYVTCTWIPHACPNMYINVCVTWTTHAYYKVLQNLNQYVCDVHQMHMTCHMYIETTPHVHHMNVTLWNKVQDTRGIL